MKLNIFDRFILKAFPRLVYLSIVLDPLTDRLFKGTRLWYVVSFVTFAGLCIWEFVRGDALRKKYGNKMINEYVCYNETEFKYDMAISVLGLVICYFMHDGPLWFILITMCISGVLKFRDRIKRWLLHL